ncbi:MAG: hypothetical protein ACTHJ4_02125 [Candidatus Nucleicultricaceae bacterium]
MHRTSFQHAFFGLFLSTFGVTPFFAPLFASTDVNQSPIFQHRVQENPKTLRACMPGRRDSDDLKQAIARFELIADHVRMTATQHAHYTGANDQGEQTILSHANKTLIEELEYLMDPVGKPGKHTESVPPYLLLSHEEAQKLLHCGQQLINSVLRDLHRPALYHTNHGLSNQFNDFKNDVLKKAKQTNDRSDIEMRLQDIMNVVDQPGGLDSLNNKDNPYVEKIQSLIKKGQSPHAIKENLNTLLKEIDNL